MPRVSSDYTPLYRLHKQSGQGIVTLAGKDYLLGPFGSPESKAKYHRLIAEWIAGGRKPLHPAAVVVADPAASGHTITTVDVLVDAYARHAKEHYRHANGSQTGEAARIELVLRPLKELFAGVAADELGPSHVKKYRETLIGRDWARTTINASVAVLRRMLRWGVAEELLKADVLLRVAALQPLKPGRSTAREPEPVTPVPLPYVDAVKPYVSSVVADMIDLQLSTGMRPGELCVMRPTDIDTTGEVWTYRPSQHKTSYRGHSRIVYLGPRAKAIVKRYLEQVRGVDEHLFSAKASHTERAKLRSIFGKQKPRRPNQKPNAKRTDRSVREKFTPDVYRRAIARACQSAGVPSWNPHRLRHNFATAVRQQFGAEAVGVAIGDRTTRMVDVYAEKNHSLGQRVAKEIG